MRKSITLFLLTAFASTFPAAPPSHTPAPPGAAKLADLAWIAGAWRKTEEHQLLEERWAEPLGNAMTGTFRWLKKGKGRVYEFLLIERTEAGITFYLRHFGPGSVAWEPVDKPLAFPLKSVSAREAVFEHPTRKKMKRLVYRRTKDDQLIVRVEGVGADGKTRATVFEFTRAK